jgi:hypothetical protein
MEVALLALAVVLLAGLLLTVALRRTRARRRATATADELASMLRPELPAEQSERERCAELAAQRAAAAELEGRLRQVRARIAVLEERQVGPPQRR